MKLLILLKGANPMDSPLFNFGRFSLFLDELLVLYLSRLTASPNQNTPKGKDAGIHSNLG